MPLATARVRNVRFVSPICVQRPRGGLTHVAWDTYTCLVNPKPDRLQMTGWIQAVTAAEYTGVSISRPLLLARCCYSFSSTAVNRAPELTRIPEPARACAASASDAAACRSAFCRAEALPSRFQACAVSRVPTLPSALIRFTVSPLQPSVYAASDRALWKEGRAIRRCAGSLASSARARLPSGWLPSGGGAAPNAGSGGACAALVKGLCSCGCALGASGSKRGLWVDASAPRARLLPRRPLGAADVA